MTHQEMIGPSVKGVSVELTDFRGPSEMDNHDKLCRPGEIQARTYYYL
jgi:hypothetical protein